MIKSGGPSHTPKAPQGEGGLKMLTKKGPTIFRQYWIYGYQIDRHDPSSPQNNLILFGGKISGLRPKTCQRMQAARRTSFFEKKITIIFF